MFFQKEIPVKFNLDCVKIIEKQQAAAFICKSKTN